MVSGKYASLRQWRLLVTTKELIKGCLPRDIARTQPMSYWTIVCCYTFR